MRYQRNILLAVLVLNNEWAKVLSPAAPGHEPQEKGVTEEVMISRACVCILSPKRPAQSNRQRAFLIIRRMYFRSLSVFCGFVDFLGCVFEPSYL